MLLPHKGNTKTGNTLLLTDAAIKRLRPPKQPGRQRDYFDTRCVGLSLRIGTSGRKTFTYLYRSPTHRSPKTGKPLVRRGTLGVYSDAFTLA